MLNKRCRIILLEIIKRKHLKIQEIAELMHVSERTIRMDIQEIDYFLMIKKIDPLYKDSKNGISIIQDNQRISLLYSLINEKDVVTASYLPEERILDIIYHMAMSEKPIKMEEFSKSLQVSKSTIIKDIEKAKLIFNYKNFSLHGTLDGMKIEGEEFAIRSILVNTYIYSMDKSAILDINKLLNHNNDQVTYRVYWRIFENSNLPFINECAKYIENALLIQLSDLKYSLLCGHLAMMIKRIKSGKQIKSMIYKKDSIINSLVEEIHDKLYENLKTKINEFEKDYIKYIIYTCSYETFLIDSGIVHENIDYITNTIINVTSSKKNKELMNKITYELKKIKIQQMLNIPTRSNVITLPDKLYKKIYEEISKKSDVFSSFMERDVNENEIWRIAYPLIQNKLMENDNLSKKVVIVSDKSEELIQLLKEHLLSLFSIDIIGICGTSNLDYILKVCKPDILLSTMKLEDYEALNIHPILSENDIESLKKVLPLHSKEKSKFIYELNDIKNEKIIMISSNEKTLIDIKVKILENIRDYVKEEFEDYFVDIKEKDIITINDVAFISHKYHETVKEEVIVVLENEAIILIGDKKINKFVTYTTKSNKNHIKVCCELMKSAKKNQIKELLER